MVKPTFVSSKVWHGETAFQLLTGSSNLFAGCNLNPQGPEALLASGSLKRSSYCMFSHEHINFVLVHSSALRNVWRWIGWCTWGLHCSRISVEVWFPAVAPGSKPSAISCLVALWSHFVVFVCILWIPLVACNGTEFPSLLRFFLSFSCYTDMIRYTVTLALYSILRPKTTVCKTRHPRTAACSFPLNTFAPNTVFQCKQCATCTHARGENRT